MPSRRSTRSSCDGFTVVELMIGLSIALIVTAAGLALAMSTLSLYEADHARIRVNRNLRATQDFLATDIRQAGERLGDDFPAIEVLDGPAGAPDEIVLRRNLLGTVLRSCRPVAGTIETVYLAELDDPPPPGCVAVPDANGDGWPDNHGAWHTWRESHGIDDGAGGKLVPAFLFDPITGDGEFFTYAEDDADEGFIRTPPGQTWQHSYPVGDQCRIYLLEERRYRVEQGMLQVILNGDDPNPANLVDRIEDLQATAVLQDGTVLSAFDFGDVWSDLRAIDVAIRSREPYDSGVMETAWSGEVMPRNVLSH